VLRFINALLAGRLPRLPALLDSRLIATVLKRGSVIHPIAIQEAFGGGSASLACAY
jgi:hypothetical protein